MGPGEGRGPGERRSQRGTGDGRCDVSGGRGSQPGGSGLEAPALRDSAHRRGGARTAEEESGRREPGAGPGQGRSSRAGRARGAGRAGEGRLGEPGGAGRRGWGWRGEWGRKAGRPAGAAGPGPRRPAAEGGGVRGTGAARAGGPSPGPGPRLPALTLGFSSDMAARGGRRGSTQRRAGDSRSPPAALPPQLLAGPRFAPKSPRAGWPARVTRWGARARGALPGVGRVPGRPRFLAVSNASAGWTRAVRRPYFGGRAGSRGNTGHLGSWGTGGAVWVGRAGTPRVHGEPGHQPYRCGVGGRPGTLSWRLRTARPSPELAPHLPHLHQLRPGVSTGFLCDECVSQGNKENKASRVNYLQWPRWTCVREGCPGDDPRSRKGSVHLHRGAKCPEEVGSKEEGLPS